ncbi:unnamed protein product [Clonostachys solani]|uniref:Sodium/calcium exchanger membrane region domain-containing protein n=1 Tax=Clonostachys solani TaxID=160281 RepID=A0A9P0EPY0_9HYPO|nr:unnamed protein product [Clonostachys solani]
MNGGQSAAQNIFCLPCLDSAELTPVALFIVELRSILFAGWINILTIFVPIGLIAHVLKAQPIVVFLTNAVAIVPLSALLTEATERIADDAGDTIGALLNISLGNIVELILFVALANGHVRIVQASILGSILVNLLLILGSALLACGVADVEASYSTSGTEVLGCLLFVSVFAFLIPTAFDYTFQNAQDASSATLKLSRVSAFMVLAIYIIYLIYEVKYKGPHTSKLSSHELDIESQAGRIEIQPPSLPATPPPRLQPRTIRFAENDDREESRYKVMKHGGSILQYASDDEEYTRTIYAVNAREIRGRGSAEGSARGTTVPGSRYQKLSRTRGHSRSLSIGSGRRFASRDSSVASSRRLPLRRSGLPPLSRMRDTVDGHDQPSTYPEPSMFNMIVGRYVSVFVLVLSSVLMSMNAEFLVSTIDDVTHDGQFSEMIIGLIILPIVGNMAEYITVVTVAVREKLDLAIAVSVGSSIQIALCVTPLTILAGWVLDRDLGLSFTFFEMATLVGSVLLVNLIIMSEGGGGPRANALRGGLMCGCYIMVG